MERFFEDTDKLFQAAHVASPTVKSQPVPVARSTSVSGVICFFDGGPNYNTCLLIKRGFLYFLILSSFLRSNN